MASAPWNNLLKNDKIKHKQPLIVIRTPAIDITDQKMSKLKKKRTSIIIKEKPPTEEQAIEPWDIVSAAETDSLQGY